MTVLTRLRETLEQRAAAGAEDEAGAVAVLWPDPVGEWEPAIGRLRAEGLRVLRLGPFDANQDTGPAVWIRAQLATTSATAAPVIYLPGVEVRSLRDGESCAAEVAPLLEFAFRGTLFTHPQGREWTLSAFLANQQAGLGLDLAPDDATRAALARSLDVLLLRDVNELAAGQLDAQRLDAMLAPDPARDMLAWIANPAAFQAKAGDRWSALAARWKKELKFNAKSDGPLEAARRMLAAEPGWAAVWRCFADAPRQHPGVVAVLRTVPVTDFLAAPDRYPTRNAECEDDLRVALATLVGEGAPTRVRELAATHAPRASSPWGELGEAPLAVAIQHLAALADTTSMLVAFDAPAPLAAWYCDAGWRADDDLLHAIASVTSASDEASVAHAADVLYRPWADHVARLLQTLASAEPEAVVSPPIAAEAGSVTVFVDALRMDLAHRIRSSLEVAGYVVEVGTRWAAVPSVTPTAKPAVTPIAATLSAGPDFSASAYGATAVTAPTLRSAIAASGVQILADGGGGDPTGSGWLEMGEVDQAGHTRGLGLARDADLECQRIAERIRGLLAQGWKRVRVVTDHGWLLLPGGFEEAKLPLHLAAKRKGRCARLAAASSTELLTLPWRWDPAVRIAIAPGLCTFERGGPYDHGGVSPQESVTPVIEVTAGIGGAVAATISQVKWFGMRARVDVTGAPAGIVVEIRTAAGDASTTVGANPVNEGGEARILVDDDALEGAVGWVVVVDNGVVVAQQRTVIGGEEG